jgi:hypothetical protein
MGYVIVVMEVTRFVHAWHLSIQLSQFKFTSFSLIVLVFCSLHFHLQLSACFFHFIIFQWKIVSGSACINTCENVGSSWRKDKLSAIELHESGVGQQSHLISIASAKLAELRSQRSQKQAELEAHRVFFKHTVDI